MFPGALQIFQNACQSGEESAKNFIRDLNIAWASKSVEVDLATLSKDNLSLVPEDIYSQPQAGIPVALQATETEIVSIILPHSSFVEMNSAGITCVFSLLRNFISMQSFMQITKFSK